MGKFRQYAYLVLLVAAISCGSHELPQERVLAIREMGALATTEYTLTKIVKASDNKTWYKVGDRKILLSVEAVLKAGIDFSLIRQEDIRIRGKSITLRLPPPQLISISLPPDKIKLEFEEVGLFRTQFDHAEREALLAQAEQQIRKAVPETGIFQTTEKNSRLFLTRFLQQLGYEEISIEFGETTFKTPLQ